VLHGKDKVLSTSGLNGIDFQFLIKILNLNIVNKNSVIQRKYVNYNVQFQLRLIINTYHTNKHDEKNITRIKR